MKVVPSRRWLVGAAALAVVALLGNWWPDAGPVLLLLDGAWLGLLLVDGLGQGGTLRRHGLPTRHDYEVPIGKCVDWLLARIAGALGETSAREAFIAVRERCRGEGMLQEVALISLDLARHLLATNPFEARAEVSSVGPILAQIGIPEDSQEVRLLRKILAAARPKLALICELSRLLYAQRKFWAA